MTSEKKASFWHPHVHQSACLLQWFTLYVVKGSTYMKVNSFIGAYLRHFPLVKENSQLPEALASRRHGLIRDSRHPLVPDIIITLDSKFY